MRDLRDGRAGALRAEPGAPRLLPGLLPADPRTELTEPDHSLLARALELAREADYATSPNPMVGAVVVDVHGRIAGEGFHERAGTPHAEAHALAQAGDRAKNGTLYVSLEPCDHHGRTPPCTEAILEAGLKRVVVAMRDPDPRASGRGLQRLKQAGLDIVEAGPVQTAQARRLNEFYVTHRTLNRPFVSLKFASTLDGKIATRTGDSRWVTGPEARHHAHLLRHRHDAILVGVNTVLADDPQLTTRLPDHPNPRQPLRIVLDSRLRTPVAAKLAGPHTLIVTHPHARPAAPYPKEVEILRQDPRDLPALLRTLAERGILSLLVEGGGTVNAAFVESGLVDKVHVYIAPKIVGGAQAPTPVAGEGVAQMAAALQLDDVTTEQLGADLLIAGYVT